MGQTLKPLLVCGVAPLDRGLDELLQFHHMRGPYLAMYLLNILFGEFDSSAFFSLVRTH